MAGAGTSLPSTTKSKPHGQVVSLPERELPQCGQCLSFTGSPVRPCAPAGHRLAPGEDPTQCKDGRSEARCKKRPGSPGSAGPSARSLILRLVVAEVAVEALLSRWSLSPEGGSQPRRAEDAHRARGAARAFQDVDGKDTAHQLGPVISAARHRRGTDEQLGGWPTVSRAGEVDRDGCASSWNSHDR
jgi:hypothetical protein